MRLVSGEAANQSHPLKQKNVDCHFERSEKSNLPTKTYKALLHNTVFFQQKTGYSSRATRLQLKTV